MSIALRVGNCCCGGVNCCYGCVEPHDDPAWQELELKLREKTVDELKQLRDMMEATYAITLFTIMDDDLNALE